MDHKGEIIFGSHAVQEALKGNKSLVAKVFLRAPLKKEAQEIQRIAAKMGVPVRVLDGPDFKRLFSERAQQGVAAQLCDFKYSDADEILKTALDKSGVAVALDLVQDPQNLGTVLRCCAFFGACGALIPKDRAAHVTSAVIRASAGAALRVPVALVTNLARTLRAWREKGVAVVGAVAHGGMDIRDLPKKGPLLLVLGSEHQGLRRLVRESCDALVTIPSAGGFESLNVGVAAGILLFEITRECR